jgi:two-component system sensor kinase FixL
MISDPEQKVSKLYESTSDAFGDLMDLLAHELNQPLTAILANVQAALRLMDRGVPDLKVLREILDDVVADDHRATEMIGNVRSVFKRRPAERKPLLLNDLIEEIMPDVRNNALAADIAIDLDLGQSLPSIEGDRGQLQ